VAHCPVSVEALDRFVAREPLWRVHKCVFGVLELESERLIQGCEMLDELLVFQQIRIGESQSLEIRRALALDTLCPDCRMRELVDHLAGLRETKKTNVDCGTFRLSELAWHGLTAIDLAHCPGLTPVDGRDDFRNVRF
jgi:hypothetical protein